MCSLRRQKAPRAELGVAGQRGGGCAGGAVPQLCGRGGKGVGQWAAPGCQPRRPAQGPACLEPSPVPDGCDLLNPPPPSPFIPLTWSQAQFQMGNPYATQKTYNQSVACGPIWVLLQATWPRCSYPISNEAVPHRKLVDTGDVSSSTSGLLVF